MSVTSPPPTADSESEATTSIGALITPYLILVTLVALGYYFYQRVNRESWIQYGVKEPKLSLLFGIGADFRTIFPNTQFFDPISLEANKYFRATLTNTVTEKRRKQEDGVKRRHLDFLDLLLKANDAAKEGKFEDNEDVESEHSKASNDVANALSDDKLLGHSMLIIFGGVETTATLQMCLFRLAENPQVQERVYQEIQSVVKSSTPTLEELTSLNFLEQVINETLRLYPPVPIVNRKAMETRTYEGITIPRGAAVIIPFYHIMTDPKVYPDPYVFNPDRFSPDQKEKRDTLAFIPFGQGPRQCLGLRLAYLELKMGLVYILRQLKSVLNEDTVPRKGEELKFSSQGLLAPVQPIILAFELRD